MKIISFVPSITETLFDFGLTSDEVIGRTKFCIHPKDNVKNVGIIGGTKNLKIDKIKALKPDLIIANKEENEKIQVEELHKDFKVWVTEIANLKDNKTFLTELGKILNKEEKAEFYNQKIDEVFSDFKKINSKKVAYLIWKNPYLSVGGDTFINEILEQLGFENILKSQTRYPEISIEKMKKADYIFLSSEPFPFKEKHINELKQQLPNSKIILVDGEAFSWYGTHLSKCENYYHELISQVQN